MKKLLILGMMVLFLSSLIAVESEPSDVVGFVKYECIVTSTTNANMVSVVLDNGVTTAQDLAAEIGAPGIVDAVSKWDATTQSWEQVAYSFSPVPPPGGWAWSGDFDIEIGESYQISVTVPATWPSRNFRDNNSFNQNIINNTRK